MTWPEGTTSIEGRLWATLTLGTGLLLSQSPKSFSCVSGLRKRDRDLPSQPSLESLMSKPGGGVLACHLSAREAAAVRWEAEAGGS